MRQWTQLPHHDGFQFDPFRYWNRAGSFKLPVTKVKLDIYERRALTAIFIQTQSNYLNMLCSSLLLAFLRLSESLVKLCDIFDWKVLLQKLQIADNQFTVLKCDGSETLFFGHTSIAFHHQVVRVLLCVRDRLLHQRFITEPLAFYLDLRALAVFTWLLSFLSLVNLDSASLDHVEICWNGLEVIDLWVHWQGLHFYSMKDVWEIAEEEWNHFEFVLVDIIDYLEFVGPARSSRCDIKLCG